MNEQLYVIWSYEHGSWWRPHSRGYTVDIKQAGLYTKKVAREICESANKYQPTNEPHETMISKEDIDKVTKDEP